MALKKINESFSQKSQSLILINQPCKAVNALIWIRKCEKKWCDPYNSRYNTKRNRDSDL